MNVPEGFPVVKGESRPWVCRLGIADCTRIAPCRSCRGRRNRRKGATSQRGALKVLEAVTGAKLRWRGKGANEETWDHLPVRCECKSGVGVKGAWGLYLRAEGQSGLAKAVGDPRPFVLAVAPDGVSDGLFLVRWSQLAAVVDALGEDR